MRSITEFEFSPNPMEHEAAREYRIGNIKNAQERHLGWVIAKSFGWDVKGVTALTKTDPVKQWFTLEIEAFPMDKWIEFKKRFKDALPDYDSVSRTRLLNALDDLESFVMTGNEKPR